MKVVIKEVTYDQSIVEVETRSVSKQLVITRTPYGHSYEDFSEWDISDKQYYDLEELVDSVTNRMSGNTSLDIEWEI